MDDIKNKREKNLNYNYFEYEKEEKKRKKRNDQIFYYGSFLILLLGIFLYYLIEKFYVPYKEIIPSSNIIKSLSDKSNYKLIQLHTGLEVLLINDPSTKKSAASLAVNAGSINDNTMGMAHFCEHMLFLGNKKYPSPSIFADNLQKYNGLYNAYTSKDKTLYFFEINNNGFIEQFKMFASLFDKPLFNEMYVNKEINAINSEHEKNKNNDYFITDFIVKNEANKNTPFKKFECGNNSTLNNKNDKMRKELFDYFENFYTNDNMKLVVLSNYTIENMSKLIEDNFISGYVAKKPKLKCENKLSYTYYKIIKQLREEPIYDPDEDFTKLAYYKSFDGKNKLNFYFILKSLYKVYSNNINPEKYFKYMINYKGENSLLNILIEKGFINDIQIEIEEQTEYYYLYKITFLLTEKGINNYQLIIKLFFGYINLIKKEGIKEETYKELNELLKIKFNFKQENNIYKKVNELALNLFMIEKKENILIGDNINDSYNKQIIFDFIEQLTLENCIIIMSINNKVKISSDLDYFQETFKSKYLPFYELEYYITFIKEDITDDIKFVDKINNNEYHILFNSNENNILNLEEQKHFYIKDIFKLRTKNNFITKLNHTIIPFYNNYEKIEIDDNFFKNAEFIPINILQEIKEKTNISVDHYKSYTPLEIKTKNKNNRLEFWYKIDNSFHIPKENIIIEIKSEIFLGNKINFAMLLLIEKFIEVKIDKYLFESKESDNSFKFEILFSSILIKIKCFSDLGQKIIEIMNKILFIELNLNDENHIPIGIFEIMKNKAINEINTYNSNLACRTTKNKLKKLIFKNITLTDELSIEDINNISIYDFEQFIHKFNYNYLLTILIHGSTTEKDINSIYESINNKLNQISNNININVNKNFLEQKEIKDNNFINYYYINNHIGEKNHVIMINYQMRLKNNENDIQKIKIYNSLYKKCIGNLFFTKLRTEKQLGYIVINDFLYFNSDKSYYSIIIQGTKKFPEELDFIINEVVFESININCNSNLEELKSSILYEINSNENNLDERTNFFKNEIINMKYDFENKKKKIEIINHVKDYDEIIKYIKFNFIEKPRRIGIFNYANSAKKNDVKTRIENVKIINGLDSYYLKNKVIYTDNEKIIFNKQ